MINANAIKAVFEGSLKLKSTESCLIVTDTVKEPIARAFHEYASRMATRSDIIVINPIDEHGAEPPEKVASEMLKYDVEILVTEKSLTHTRARREATERGARIATMPTITEEIANRCLDIDYEELKKESQHIYNVLKDSSEVRVVTELGTDITFKVGGSGFFGKDGGSFDYPGAYGNLPEGEVAFAPETCEGTFIVDASFADLGILASPLTFRAREGNVYEIEGENSGQVKQRLDKAGPRAYRVAELGIGLNPKAMIIGNILEDEKVIGTVHVAVGNNLSFGGDNDVPLHLDGVITGPEIYLDGKKLMEKGKFLEF
ncbi:MAG: aminopeptidase [Candidatus Omnitrophica bacterium]|nr:aminopeptidase [Candidatus Omnitrophota bacterium]